MRHLLFLSMLGLVWSLGACGSTPQTSVDPLYDTDFVLVVLKSGARVAEYSEQDRARIQGEHLANIMRLAEERKLCLAGPFGVVRPDSSWRGIFVFDVPSVEEARALTDTDPAVQAGVLAMDLRPMRATSCLREFLEAELKAADEARRAGRERKLQDTIRGYVLVLSKDAVQAEELLDQRVGSEHVLLRARLGEREGLFVLDHPDAATTEKALEGAGAAAEGLVLYEWYAAKGLVALPEIAHSK